MSNLINHAKRELLKLGYKPVDDDNDKDWKYLKLEDIRKEKLKKLKKD